MGMGDQIRDLMSSVACTRWGGIADRFRNVFHMKKRRTMRARAPEKTRDHATRTRLVPAAGPCGQAKRPSNHPDGRK